jgi:cytidine deaminase
MRDVSIRLTPSEKKLITHSKKAIVKYNKMRHAKGGIDTLYSFLLSDSGAIYDGACFEPNIGHAAICGERHAIANMACKESYTAKIKSIVVADPVATVQEHGTPPCGTCRHLIWQFRAPTTSVILLQYVQGKDTWTFPRLERYTIADLYPHPYEPIESRWDGYEPPYGSNGIGS